MTQIGFGKMIRRLAALFVVLSLILAARPAAAQSTFTKDQVRQLVLLGRLRGQAIVASAAWDASDLDMTKAHTDIAHELISSLSADLQKAKVDPTLTNSLDAFTSLSAKTGDQSQFHGALQTLLDAVQSAANAFAPAAVQDDPIFRLSVAQGLLASMEREYEEAVKDGKIAGLEPYQSAVGYLMVAQSLYTAAQPKVQGLSSALDDTLSKQYKALGVALPGIQPPATVTDPKQIAGIVDSIKTSIQAALKVQLEVPREAAEVLAATRQGLLGAIDAYAKGKADDAYEAASSAYLDNFEGLEGDLRAKDADLTNLLESQIVDFGKLIKAGKALDELKAAYTQIDANLSKAEALLR